jgi:hypothetical protein
MPLRILAHLRANVVAYLALFVALGGSSYAAVRLAPGSVTARAIAAGAVTHSKLARASVDATNIVNGSLTSSVFKPGALAQALDHGSPSTAGAVGLEGPQGAAGAPGAVGQPGPQGTPGGASVGARARFSGSVSAPNGGSTSVPLSSNTWTQAANELDLITGAMTVHIPSSCTGSFGNALVVSVDGTPQTFAVAPTAPASGTVTMPFAVGTLTEPGQSTPHTLTTAFGNSCTKSGESYTVTDVKADIIRVP